MKRLCIAALCAALICAAPAWAGASAAEEQPEAGIVPRYLLMDHRGRAVTDQDFRGRFQLIAFGYTFCPDICPTTLAEMALILEKLGDQARRVQPLFISVDPERDTPEVLRRYTEFFDSRIIGLTGSPELVRRVADHFKVRYEKHWEPGAKPDNYSIDHSAGMYLLGPDGAFITKFAYAMPPQEIADRLRALMASDQR
jgi:protein SCO1/2